LARSISSTEPVVVVTKAAWYKELAGVVGAAAWLALIGLFVWAVITPERQIIEWWYELGILTIALSSSMYRSMSSRVNAEIMK